MVIPAIKAITMIFIGNNNYYGSNNNDHNNDDYYVNTIINDFHDVYMNHKSNQPENSGPNGYNNQKLQNALNN